MSRTTGADEVTGQQSTGPWRWMWVVGGAVGVGFLALRDPNQSGSYGFCPLRSLTGLDCPFCGGLRGTYALLHGDIATALDHNVLLPVYLVGLAVLIGAVLRGSPPGFLDRPARRRRWVWGFVALVVAFFIVRNLPWFPFLDSSA